MIVRVSVCARKRQRWTDAQDSEKRHSTRGSADGKYTGSVVIARDLAGRPRGSRVKVQLIRLESLWYIYPRSGFAASDPPSRMPPCGYLPLGVRIMRGRGIDGTPLPEVVLDSVGLPGAFGWVCLIAVSRGSAVSVF